MTAMTRCECCDLPAESCGKDLERRQIAEQRTLRAHLLTQPRWSLSAYPGQCSDCGEHFRAATPITRNPTDDGWRAACCALPEERP